MTAGALTPTEERARLDGMPATLDDRPIESSNPLEVGLRDRLDAAALAVVAAGLVLRIFAASRSYLNPDEAMHYILLNQPSAYLAYKASLTNAHPPLIYLAVYFWHFLGRSEWMLRLPSVVAGTAFCWFFYKWATAAFGRAAGWAGLVLVTFSPAMIDLSSELRAYALLLCGIGGALYFLERACGEKSARDMWIFSAFLCLAILSHYSAAFFALAVGVYALARIADSELPPKLIAAWAAGQAVALAICGFLYVTHVSKLKSSIEVWNTGFGTAYFHADSTNLFRFTWENTLGIFLFLFRQRDVAVAMLLLFAAGVAFFLARGLRAVRGNAQSNRLGILLLFPFLAVWGASIAGIYPYVGSRHTAFLAPFALGAASYMLAAVCRQRLWGAVLLAALVIVASNTAHADGPTEEIAGNGTPAQMAAAVRYMEQTIPAGDVILVDYQSSFPITYYLCGPKTIFPIDSFSGDPSAFPCNGYTVVSLRIWKLIPRSFPYQFEKMAKARGLAPGTRVWLYQTGWGPDLGAELPGQDFAFRCLAPRRFGDGVSVTPFVVGPDLSPLPASGPCGT